jgi:tryptophan-rich sensory protein
MTTSAPLAPAGSPRSLRFALLAVVAVAAAAFLGQMATAPNLDPWFAELRKPAFNPPRWLFAPVWTTLYVLMALAAWRILRLPAATPGRATALALFFAQLLLNGAWSWMFFAARNPLLGLINIVPQLLLVLATLFAFRRIDAIAGWLLVPLAVWVGFATVLNFSIWRLNA